MAGHPVAREDGAAQRDLAGQHDSGADLGQLAHLARTEAAEHLQALPLGGQPRATPDGRHDERRQRDRPVVVAVVQQLRCTTMPACDSATLAASWPVAMNRRPDRWPRARRCWPSPPGTLRSCSSCRLRTASSASTPMIFRSRSAGSVASATTRLPRVRSMLICGVLLVGVDPPGQHEPRCAGMVLDDPLARSEGGPAHHVLPGRVARGEVEAQVQQWADGVLLDLRRARRRGWWPPQPRRSPADGARPTARSHGPPARRRTRRPVPAASGRRPPWPALRRHRSAAASRGCSWRPESPRWWPWDVEVPCGVLAVDPQRPREPDRHLRDTGEVLDVARQAGRVDRVGADVRQRRRRSDLADEVRAAPLADSSRRSVRTAVGVGTARLLLSAGPGRPRPVVVGHRSSCLEDLAGGAVLISARNSTIRGYL